MHKLKRILYLFIAVCLTIVFVKTALSYEETYLITFGNQASTEEGDDDFFQIIFIRLPKDYPKPIFVRIFDADCGGERDALYNGVWDTQTRFRLFGGKGAFSQKAFQMKSPDIKDIEKGSLIVDKTFGIDPFQDNQWSNLATIKASQGHVLDNFSYFKLVIEGIKGDDGNTFLVEVSTTETRNMPPDNVLLFTFSPTIHLPDRHVFSEMRLIVPPNTPEIIVHNFDLYSAHISVETRFRTQLHVDASGQNEWCKSAVSLNPNEPGYCAIRFKGGKEMPNDGTFYVTDHQEKMLPIELPIRILRQNKRPDIKVNVKSLSNCTSVMFDASETTDPENDAMTFVWEFGDGTKGKGIRTTHEFPSPGLFETTLMVTDDAGQVYNSVLKTIPVRINQKPVASAGNNVVAAPGVDIEFDASQSTDADGQIIRYFWDFGDGYKLQGKVVSHAYNKPDVYVAELRVEDDSENPCNSNTDQREIQINARPVVEIGKNRIASPNQTIEFDANNSKDSDGRIVSFVWDMGDETKLSGQQITHAYQKPGTYTVHLLITDNSNVQNSTNEDSLSVFVNDHPVANAGKDFHVSALETIHFDGRKSYDNDGNIILYEWDFGDGEKANGKQVKHAYRQPGKYTVQLTVTDDSTSTSNKHSDKAVVIINYPPVSNAGEDQWLTSSEVQFDATKSKDHDGSIISYDWNFGDGQTGKGSTPVHVYASPGTYVAYLTVTDDSKTSTQSDTDAVTIVVNATPIADAGPDQVVTPGETFQLDGSLSIDPDGSIQKYIWHLGDGKTVEQAKLEYRYTTPGCYGVLLEVHDNSFHKQAVHFDEVLIYVNHPPVAVAGSDQLVAPHQEIVFDAKQSYDLDGKIIAWQWTFSDQEKTLDQPIVKRSFDHPGIYTAKLQVTDSSQVNNSVVQDQVTIHVNHPPVANPGKNIHTHRKEIFLDGSASSDADGHLLNFFWDLGDGSPIQKGRQITHHYASGGIYPVILTVDDGTQLNNARSNASITIQINESPIANAGENRTVCAGSVVIFNGAASIDPEGGTMNYEWNFGDGTSKTGINPTKTFFSGGIYPVILRVTDDSGLSQGNTDTDQVVITVAESPVADAGQDQTVCAGMMVQFDGSKSTDIDGLVNQFHWDFGDGTSGGGPNPTHAYLRSGKYRVELSITGDRVGNCDFTDTDEMYVTVYDAPTAKFTAVSAAAEGLPVTFDASMSNGNGADISQWNWDFGDDHNASGKKVDHVFTKAGTYIISLTITTETQTECNQAIAHSVININAQPKAIAGNDRTIGVNEWTLFDASQSVDPDGAISQYLWDFGDGTKGKGVSVRHQYQQSGTYTVGLIVTDNTNVINNQSSSRLTVIVNEAPVPKIIVIQPEKRIYPPFATNLCLEEQITLSGKLSTDSDGDSLEYYWQMGDGQRLSGETIKHNYQKPGKYTVVLTVNDNKKTINSQVMTTVDIIVNEKPLAHAGIDQIVSPNQIFTLDAGVSLDPDGRITEYRWEYNKRTIGSGSLIKHSFKEPGTYMIQLTTFDDSQLSCNQSTDSLTIRVNAPPVPLITVSQLKFQPSKNSTTVYQMVAQQEGPVMVYVGGSHDEIWFSAQDSYDPDKDLLTFQWDFGDNTQAMGQIVKHTFFKPGEYDVALVVNDGQNVDVSRQTKHIQVIAKKR